MYIWHWESPNAFGKQTRAVSFFTCYIHMPNFDLTESLKMDQLSLKQKGATKDALKMAQRIPGIWWKARVVEEIIYFCHRYNSVIQMAPIAASLNMCTFPSGIYWSSWKQKQNLHWQAVNLLGVISSWILLEWDHSLHFNRRRFKLWKVTENGFGEPSSNSVYGVYFRANDTPDRS